MAAKPEPRILTDLQKAWAKEYIGPARFNATAAARSVGMTESEGRRIRALPHIVDYIEMLQAERLASELVEGGVRDWEEQQQFRFPLFVRHVVPTPGKTRIRVEAIGEPITIEGVLIRPDDLIVADGSGICVLPAEHAERILQLSAQFAADDRQAEDEIAKGLSFREALSKFAKI